MSVISQNYHYNLKDQRLSGSAFLDIHIAVWENSRAARDLIEDILLDPEEMALYLEDLSSHALDSTTAQGLAEGLAALLKQRVLDVGLKALDDDRVRWLAYDVEGLAELHFAVYCLASDDSYWGKRRTGQSPNPPNSLQLSGTESHFWFQFDVSCEMTGSDLLTLSMASGVVIVSSDEASRHDLASVTIPNVSGTASLDAELSLGDVSGSSLELSGGGMLPALDFGMPPALDFAACPEASGDDSMLWSPFDLGHLSATGPQSLAISFSFLDGDASLEVSDGGTLTPPELVAFSGESLQSLAAIDGSSLEVCNRGALALPALTSYQEPDNAVHLEATRAGSMCSLPNLILGNQSWGVFGTSDNLVEGNYVGTDSTGTFVLGNGSSGVCIFDEAVASSIDGPVTGDDNLILDNQSSGVLISDVDTSGHLVEGNLIGTDLTDTSAFGHIYQGVFVEGGAAVNRSQPSNLSMKDGMLFSPDYHETEVSGRGLGQLRSAIMADPELFGWLVLRSFDDWLRCPLDAITEMGGIVLALDPCDEQVRDLNSKLLLRVDWNQTVPFLVLTRDPDPPAVHEFCRLIPVAVRREIQLETNLGKVILLPQGPGNRAVFVPESQRVDLFHPGSVMPAGRG